jgi:hypothetical protein
LFGNFNDIRYFNLNSSKVFLKTSKAFPFCVGVASFEGLTDHQLKQMIQKSSDSGRMICRICKQDFVNPSSALNHVKAKHVSGSLHPCPYCQLTFKTPSLKNTHVYRKHLELHRISKIIKK